MERLQIRLVHDEHGDTMFIENEKRYYCPASFSDCPEDATIWRDLLTPQLYLDGMKKAFELAGLDIADYVTLDERYKVDDEDATEGDVEDARFDIYG